MLIIKDETVYVYFLVLCACCKLTICLLVLPPPRCLGWSLLAPGQAGLRQRQRQLAAHH